MSKLRPITGRTQREISKKKGNKSDREGNASGGEYFTNTGSMAPTAQGSPFQKRQGYKVEVQRTKRKKVLPGVQIGEGSRKGGKNLQLTETGGMQKQWGNESRHAGYIPLVEEYGRERKCYQ